MRRLPRKARPRPRPERLDLIDHLPLGSPWGGLVFSVAGLTAVVGTLWLLYCVTARRPVWPW